MVEFIDVDEHAGVEVFWTLISFCSYTIDGKRLKNISLTRLSWLPFQVLMFASNDIYPLRWGSTFYLANHESSFIL